MSGPLQIDATALRDWASCREFYRFLHHEKIISAKPQIHREFGIAVHLGCEAFWKDIPYQQALLGAMEHCDAVTGLELLPPPEREKWDTMLGNLPDVLATYYDSAHVGDEDPTTMLEHEWLLVYAPGVDLCGRIDRFTTGRRLVDVKTASEIGRTWASDYRKQMLRDPGLAMYDWYLCQIGNAPMEAWLEVLVKPYRDKPSRLELFNMKEIVSSGYRRRFAQQLKWAIAEITHYHDNYGNQKPWPMNTSHSCFTKYGPCGFLEICTGGMTPRNEHKFIDKPDHLTIRKGE